MYLPLNVSAHSSFLTLHACYCSPVYHMFVHTMFVSKEHCFPCGRPVKFEGRKRGYNVIRYIQKTSRITYNKSAKSGMMNGWKRSGGDKSLHKIYMLQTLCTTKRAVSTFGWENRFRRSMGMILIQSLQRGVLWIQLNLKRS